MVKPIYKGKHKFNAERINGFDSKLEQAVFFYLEFLEKKGEISDIRKQDTVYLTKAKISWRVDFSALDKNGKRFYVEAKGLETIDYKLKKKLWEVYGPGRLEIWKGTYQKPKLHEVIEV